MIVVKNNKPINNGCTYLGEKVGNYNYTGTPTMIKK